MTELMPDLVGGTREFQHSLDTALHVLTDLGARERVQVRCAEEGAGARPLAIVHQTPAPRTALTPSTPIILTVSAPPGLHSVPFALRTGGRPRPGVAPELIFGIDRLTELFDHEVQLAGHATRRSGDYLELRPDRESVSRRWVERIFALHAFDDWSPVALHRLARLLPALHRLAGTEAGLRIVMRDVFALDVVRLSLAPRSTPVDDGDATRLAVNASYLGVSATLGQCVDMPNAAVVTYRVPDAATWARVAGAVPRRVRDVVYPLMLPLVCDARALTERWLVGDGSNGIRLDAHTPPSLGIGSYLAHSSGAAA